MVAGEEMTSRSAALIWLISEEAGGAGGGAPLRFYTGNNGELYGLAWQSPP
ncbi:hypothetical protein Pmi06nite_76060 [Planotetraspora mira]|uniref:Uncharacterized protein n=1 Tax=Planotetraspora mira TaxID=58121 RepID=A0A8J3TX73_9ACTN|nr:hypothetical protein Pmi06nite_76060 [Planotetraspora mira]